VEYRPIRFLSLRVLGWILAAPFVMGLGPERAFAHFRPRVDLSARGAISLPDLIVRADRLLLFRVFGRLLFRTRCYKRTLVLYRLLRLHGFDARAVVGVDLDDEKGIVGHAWLTVDGCRIEDPIFTPPRRFVALMEIGDRVEVLTGA
jgi:hypothetical protein